MILDVSQTAQIADLLLDEKIGVMPTDTIYGVHCLANYQALIDRIYQIKHRPDKMPFITLVKDKNDLHAFGVDLKIFKLADGSTRSFRQPNNAFLLNILSQTGPLISTSANIHG